MSSRRTMWLLDLFVMVNCKTLHAWSVCQKHPGLGSVLVVGTPVILNSCLVLTFAGHVQVQREKNHCPREAWDTKLCKKPVNQSIHQSNKNVSISLQARQLRNGMIALKDFSLNCNKFTFKSQLLSSAFINHLIALKNQGNSNKNGDCLAWWVRMRWDAWGPLIVTWEIITFSYKKCNKQKRLLYVYKLLKNLC